MTDSKLAVEALGEYRSGQTQDLDNESIRNGKELTSETLIWT